MKSLSVVVIGHVDHGKTTLVRALTGKDTDRLEEERVRGVSIVPGFALLRGPDCEIDLIDAPGHERFVRAMISGASGVEALLIAIAATEGVKPQTLEHLEIARFLGIQRGVVALTKCDLVDEVVRRSRIAEMQELAADHGIVDATVIPTEAPSGRGVAEVAAALASLADKAPPPRDDDFAYLPIDRVFSAPGFGPVVTGTLRRGVLHTGDALELRPGGATASVRSLQIHNRTVTSAPPGRRVAVALRGVELSEIRRGMSLGSPGRLVESEWLDVEVGAAMSGGAPLRDGQMLRVLSGALEADCRLRLLDAKEIAPGSRAVAQIRCTPAIALPSREPFILRRISPAATLGGGRTLDPTSRRRRRGPAPASLLAQAAGDQSAALLERLREAGRAGESMDALARFAGLPAHRVEKFLLKAGAWTAGSTRAYHPDVWATMLDELRDAIDRHHVLHPLDPGLRIDAAARAIADCPDVHTLANTLAQTGDVLLQHGVLRRPNFAPGEGGSGNAALQLAEKLRVAGLSPPDESELVGADARLRDSMRFLIEQNVILRARDRVQNRSILFHRDAIADAQLRLASAFPAQAPFTAGEAGAALGISRKYSIPLLEYLDGIKYTQRRGDRRIVLAPDAAAQEIGGDRGLVAPLVFKTSGSPKTSGGFDSHPPPPHNSEREKGNRKRN